MAVGDVVVKLDFTNAFNSLRRQDMLMSVKELFGLRLYYVYYGQFTLWSNEGPQQGDPLGPPLFSNTVHPLLTSLDTDLSLGYLDDFTLGGQQGIYNCQGGSVVYGCGSVVYQY